VYVVISSTASINRCGDWVPSDGREWHQE